jgi:hypothetical protein
LIFCNFYLNVCLAVPLAVFDLFCSSCGRPLLASFVRGVR